MTAPSQVVAGARIRTVLYVENNSTNMMLTEALIGHHADMGMFSQEHGDAK